MTKLSFGLALTALALMPFSLLAQETESRFTLPEDALMSAAINAGTRQTDGRPGGKYWSHQIRYQIDAELNTETHELSGTAVIELRNGSPRALNQLLLHLRQNLHVVSESRRIEKTGGVRLGAIELTRPGAAAQQLELKADGTILNIPLDPPLAIDDVVSLKISWVHQVPKRGAPRQGRVDDELYYLGYWYPQLAVDDDLEGWVAEQYVGSGEFYMPYADYQLTFRAPENYVVQATGSLMNPQAVLPAAQLARLEKAKAVDDVIAVIDETDLEAKNFTLDVEGDILTWKFEAKNVRDCAISAGRRYLWDALRVRPVAGQPAAMVHSFYRPGQEGWRKSARAGRKAVEYGSRIFPYPWPHMSLCEGASGGGMEYPMMTTIDAGNSERTVANVIIHETIHMWFPMIAGSNEKRYAWMDEGMTSCLTALAADELFEDQTESRRAFESYRVTAERLPNEEAMMIHGDHYVTRSGYGVASYMKPSAVFHQLRFMVGDDRFFHALQEYLQDWCYKHPSPQDFFASFSRSTGQDLDWYFKQYCYETWRVDYAIEDVKTTNQRSQITIVNHGEAVMPTAIEVTLSDGSRQRIEIDLATAMATKFLIVDVAGEVVAAKIDPDDRLLDVDRKNNSWAQ